MAPGIYRLPNGRYQARWRGPNGEYGKATLDKLADAKAHRAKVAVSKLAGEYVDRTKSRQSFGEYVERWRADQVHYTGSTPALVDSRLRNHILPTFGHRPIGSISTTAVEVWIADRSKVMAPRTMEGVYRLLATILIAAVEDGVLAKHPCPKKPNLPKIAGVPVVPLPVDAIPALAEAAPELDTYGHLWPDDEDGTRRAIDAILAPAPPTSGSAAATAVGDVPQMCPI